MRNGLFLLPVIALFISSCGNNKTPADPVSSSESTNTSAVPKELQELNEKIAKDTTNATLFYTRAKYYLNVRDFNASMLDMSHVMKLDSMKPDYYITISDIYLFGNHSSKCKDALEKCLSLDPKNTEAMIKLAQLYFYVKKYQESINMVNEALKIDNYIPKAYFLKGLNYKEAGDTAKAISSMITATEQDQEFYSAFEEIGAMYAAKKNKLGISYFDNALRINPKSVETYYNKGKLYQDLKDWDNAVKTYQDLLKMEPNHKHTHYNLGAIALVEKEDYSQAIKHFTDALTIDPKYVEAYYARGTCYFQSGDKVKAKADYQMAVQIDPAYQPAVEALKEF